VPVILQTSFGLCLVLIIGQDVQFVTGVSFRGNWANEGKVLFLLDGQQINDLLYQTVPLLKIFLSMR